MLAARRMMNRRGCTTHYVDCDTVTDAFNRSDYGDGTLGFADTGQRWLAVGDNTWTTQGTTPNTAQGIVPALDHYRIISTVLDAGGNNQDITADGEADDDDSLRIFARVSADLSNYYMVTFSAYSTPTVERVIGASVVTVASMPTITPDTPFTARVVVEDANLRVYIDGVNVVDEAIPPDDAAGNCETDWTYMGIAEDHGGSGGSAPTQLTVYTNTHWDNLNVSPPGGGLFASYLTGLPDLADLTAGGNYATAVKFGVN